MAALLSGVAELGVAVEPLLPCDGASVVEGLLLMLFASGLGVVEVEVSAGAVIVESVDEGDCVVSFALCA